MKTILKSDQLLNRIVLQLLELQQKPTPFEPGEALFWDDPHISARMLEAHLNPDIDAASRRPETIDRSVKWMIETLALKAGDFILDLGCGPGLYTSRFARAGLHVTGVDYSRRSIEYAVKYANENNLDISYRYQNYLELKDESQYDAATLIYGDFCTINPEQRSALLYNIYRALKPAGKFVLDVSTCECRKSHGSRNRWQALESGFCKPTPHLLLQEGFDYPELSIWLDQAIVIEGDGKVSVYRNWFQDYTPETIAAELTRDGFTLDGLYGDLTGMLYTPDSEWIGLVARKKCLSPV